MAGKGFEAINLATLKRNTLSFIASLLENVQRQLDFDFSTFRVNYRHSENICPMAGSPCGDSKAGRIKMGGRDALTAIRKRQSHRCQKSALSQSLLSWRRIMERYKNKAMFIGLPEEHDAFQREFGTIEYRRTENILEVAELIAGSQMFVGNQSCPAWIAIGLAHPIGSENVAGTSKTAWLFETMPSLCFQKKIFNNKPSGKKCSCSCSCP